MSEPNQAAGANPKSGTKQSFTPFQEFILYNSVCALDAGKARYQNKGWYFKICAPDKGPQNLKSHLHKKNITPFTIGCFQKAWEHSLFQQGRPPSVACMVQIAEGIQSTHKAADKSTESQQNGRSLQDRPVGTKRRTNSKQSRITKQTNTSELATPSSRAAAKKRVQGQVTATKSAGSKARMPKAPKPSFLSQESTIPETNAEMTVQQQSESLFGMAELARPTEQYQLPHSEYLDGPTLESSWHGSDPFLRLQSYSLADSDVDGCLPTSELSWGEGER